MSICTRPAAGVKATCLVCPAYTGNANCATGTAGIEEACRKTCAAAAGTFGCLFDEVFPSSTGIIGVPLPAEKLVNALPELAAEMGDGAEHAEMFARAMMTTDTRMKVAQENVDVGGAAVRLFGAAKGARMIHPQLVPPHATMLVYLFTDLAAAEPALGLRGDAGTGS